MIDKIDEPIIPLTHGRVTQNIFKIGNTVRRPLNQNSNFVHSLLKHLENVGFSGAPRFLGIEKNQEILSYIEGEVPTDIGDHTDDQLIAAAKLIRQYHDATTTSELKGNDEVVCHNDLSICNTVLNNGQPIAFIDFDAASPGSRATDLAYAVWLWCDLGEKEITAKNQARKIKLMCDSYCLEDRKNFISEIIKIQKIHIEKFKLNVEQGMTQWKGAISWGENCLKWVTKHRKMLEEILNKP